MKKITDTAARAEVVKNALAAIKVLSDMEMADLKELLAAEKAKTPAKAATTAKPAAAPAAKPAAKAGSKQTADADGNIALLNKINAYLDTPAGQAAAAKKPAKPDEKGFRPRNGRMDIIRAVVSSMGVATATQELLDKVNEVSVSRGLTAINKTAFYTLVSEVRKELA